ncbi:uncharacterized protein C14orf93-like [Branchiostoma floridae]|uniref:Uncharacterized protein C14orf93-like n=1 Tax=Branchiostoma floridae TaxID=7739 RepID=A0A9J7MR48_BRAFL|nr:uncharacterized protein C14orf93-like [Branchiostoma floridae]
MVRRLHNSNEDDKKYEGKEGLNSPHNLAVTTFLVKEIAAIGEHPSDMIRAACVGYYETIRRNYTLSLPENKEKKEKEKKEKRLRSRRKRLLDVRSEVVQTEEEEGIWAGVTQELMSDEEDSSSNGMAVWLVKPPVFRSQQLSDLCSALQTRLEADPKYLAANRKPRLRVEGTQSDRDLPRVYDPDRAAVHFTPGSAPRPAVRPCLTTISANNNNRSSTSNRTPPPRRPTGRSLAFQSEDSPSRALEGYNVASFVDEDFLSDMDDNSLTPL